jgi:hypothetical protein
MGIFKHCSIRLGLITPFISNEKLLTCEPTCIIWFSLITHASYRVTWWLWQHSTETNRNSQAHRASTSQADLVIALKVHIKTRWGLVEILYTGVQACLYLTILGKLSTYMSCRPTFEFILQPNFVLLIENRCPLSRRQIIYNVSS